MKIRLIICTLLLCFYFISLSGYSQTDKPATEHTITKIKDMIEEASGADWAGDSGEKVVFNSKDDQARFGAKEGFKRGFVDVSMYSPNQSIKQMLRDAMADDIYEKTLDIELTTNPTSDKSSVRGVYRLKLPPFKRIQLEADYDIILDDPNDRDLAEFYVEVLQESSKEAGKWISTGERRQEMIQNKLDQNSILEITDKDDNNSKHLFTPHSFNANLSEWAGQDVKLVLVAESSRKDGKKIKGRWTNAKLMGATFDLKVVSE